MIRCDRPRRSNFRFHSRDNSPQTWRSRKKWSQIKKNETPTCTLQFIRSLEEATWECAKSPALNSNFLPRSLRASESGERKLPKIGSVPRRRLHVSWSRAHNGPASRRHGPREMAHPNNCARRSPKQNTQPRTRRRWTRKAREDNCASFHFQIASCVRGHGVYSCI